MAHATFPEDAEACAKVLKPGRIDLPSLVVGGSASLGPVMGAAARGTGLSAFVPAQGPASSA